ncbi:sulfurtransferase [Nocardioides sp.]|uniref:sulfurtransferase n=1 Tax=Nocardioides sp. TaxID=35761 RepID=UPI00260D887B|nr:sulfurtransferase [Nocardioides sp.]
MTVLTTATELAQALESPHPPVVLDVRWLLGGPPGHPEYLSGHIPGAVYVSLDDELARHGEPTDGRHPLPGIEDLQASARRWGIDDGTAVVAYDANASLAAARAWWLLRWAGLGDVTLLDGGLQAWTTEGYALATDDVTPRPGGVTLSAGHQPVLEFDAVTSYDGVLLDARAAERYRGETEPIDPKAGHIPGALNAPTTLNLTSDGHFLPAGVLRAQFHALGIESHSDVAVYCGSGVTAAHEIAALAIAGVEARLYPGSWSQWSNHDLGVETD